MFSGASVALYLAALEIHIMLTETTVVAAFFDAALCTDALFLKMAAGPLAYTLRAGNTKRFLGHHCPLFVPRLNQERTYHNCNRGSCKKNWRNPQAAINAQSGGYLRHPGTARHKQVSKNLPWLHSR